MKRKVYIRISNKTNKMDISMKRKFDALDIGYSRFHNYKPTITICLNLDIPDEVFSKAQSELNIKVKNPLINSDIKVEEDLK